MFELKAVGVVIISFWLSRLKTELQLSILNDIMMPETLCHDGEEEIHRYREKDGSTRVDFSVC